LASLVPQPFRSYAQAQIVTQGLAGGGDAETLREALRLVALRPAPAEHFTMLALAQSDVGAEEASMRTIQLGAARGWRDTLAQDAMARIALAAGDAPEAARRYTALLLQGDAPDALLEELGPYVFQEAGGAGRSTMIEIVSGTQRWGSLYLRRGSAVMPPDAFREISARSIEAGAQFDCGPFRQAVNTLSRRDERAGAALAEAAPRDCSLDR
jgi:hypothetical protein